MPTDCPDHGPMRVTGYSSRDRTVTASCKFCPLNGTWHADAVRIVNNVVQPA